jgi:REP element-mobilizing transposase RayT
MAKRTMFENRLDQRKFLSLVAKEVRAGRIKVHAYCLMLNHFHLLLESVTGELSTAMANIQREYSRWFNRSRKRDGPLVKDRFKSRVVRDMTYRCNALTYIHDNPVAAKVVAAAEDYEASSAYVWARRGSRKLRRWVAADWIQRELDARDATELEEVFPSRIEDDFREMVERQLGIRQRQDEEDTTLRHTLGMRAVRWAVEKTKMADGTRPFHRISPALLVERAIVEYCRQIGPLHGYFKCKTRDAWNNLKAGLFRALSGCTQREIGMRVNRHNSSVCRDLQEHRALLEKESVYTRLHARITSDVIEAMRQTARTAAAAAR